MEDVQSPFKSPSVNDFPSSSRRTRIGSGSSVASSEKEAFSPCNRLNIHGATATPTYNRAESEGRDENDPRSFGGEHSRVNPFEKDVLAGLQGSFWSPSILEIKETPPQRSWAIEHMSQLFPKDIENSPSTHQNSFPVDDQMEAKAQADIDAYFSRGPIVPTPSPMKQTVIKFQEQALKLKTTSTDTHYGQSPIARGLGVGMGLNGGNIKKLKKVSVSERWTQTSISLPVELPAYIEHMLWQYSQNVDECGTSGETVTHYCSQQSETSYQAENGDTNDSGKNSSSLNNSIRRRLELSFGEDPDGEDGQGLSQGFPTSPIADPFRRNHVVSTPPNALSHFHLNTTTSELEVQLMRCEFTPETRAPSSFAATPGITPIQDDPDDLKSMQYHASSTPRRSNNTTARRWMTKEDMVVTPSSPKDKKSSPSSNTLDQIGSDVSDQPHCNLLRRSRTVSNGRIQNKKRCSASSFDGSLLIMDDSSPPSKLYRKNSRSDEDRMPDS